MTKKNRNETYIRTPRAAQRVRRIVTGLVLGGSVIAASAIVLSVPEPEQARAEAPVDAVSPAPARPQWAQRFEAEPSGPEAPRVEAGAPTIEAQIPVQAEASPKAPKVALSIPHEDTETDFAKQAEELLDAGDVQGALTAMRKHIHAAEATQEELFTIGTLAREVEAHPLAEAALLEAEALEPARADVLVELSRLYLETGDLAAARDKAMDAVDLSRDNPAAWNTLGRIAMEESQWEQAEMALSHALELDPTNPMYHNNAGLLYIYMKQGVDAVDALETSVELFDNDAPHFVFNNLGLAHELVGNYEEAREAFEEALLMNPFYSRAKVNLRRVEGTLAKREQDSSFQTAQGVSLEPEATRDGT